MKINITRPTFGMALVAFHLLASSFHASGQQKWQNTDPEGGSWHDTTNWDERTPTAATTAHIDNGGWAIVSGTDGVSAHLHIGIGTHNNRLEVSGVRLSVRNVYLGTDLGTSSGFLHLKTGALFEMSGELLLAQYGEGHLVIDSGATLRSTSTTGAAQRMSYRGAGNSTALVRGTWELGGGRLDIGFTGKAALTVGAGGLIDVGTGGTIVLGEQSATTAFGTLNIGGAVVDGVAQTAEAAGNLNAATLRGGTPSGSGGHGIINFNHTSSRHEFVNSEGTAIAINGNVRTSVNLYSGTTVLAAASEYRGGTDVYGGTLLANHQGAGSSTGTGAVTIHADGTLGGIGLIAGATTVQGLLAPGDLDAGHGILSFGNHLSLAATSTTLVRVSGAERGTEYDAFSVAGTLTLGGTLQVTLDEGFTFAGGEALTLTIFDAGTFSGVFGTLDLAESHHGKLLTWDTSNLYQNGTLSVTAIPEPQTVALLGGAAAALLLFRRKTSLS